MMKAYKLHNLEARYFDDYCDDDIQLLGIFLF